MSVTYLGPFPLTAHYEPSFSWLGEPMPASASRLVSIAGVLEWGEAKGLQELVTNPHRRVTVGSDVGVPEIVWNSDELLRDFNGWYLFQSLSIDAQQIHSIWELVPITLTAAYLGHRRLVVSRSASARPDDFTLTARSLLAQVLYNDVDGGDAFESDPGGSEFTREYDPRTAHLSTATTGRDLKLYQGTVT